MIIFLAELVPEVEIRVFFVVETFIAMFTVRFDCIENRLRAKN